jgi:ferredoxin
MTTEYEVNLDRTACDGVFACLVRDDRFREATDGLATVGGDRADGDDSAPAGEVETARFEDGRVEDARTAARACPVDAIDVEVVDGE